MLDSPDATAPLLSLVPFDLPDATRVRLQPVMGPLERRLLNRQLLELAARPVSGREVEVIRRVGPDCRAGALEKPYRARMLEQASIGTAVWAAVRLKLGRTTFDYADPQTLSAQKVTHGGAALTASLALLTPTNHFVSLSLKREIAYEPADDPVDVCNPYEETASLTCANLTIGPPAERKRTLGWIEYRKRVGKRLAAGPILQYDFTEEKAAFSVPVYFLSSDKGFSGGVNLTQAEAKEFSAAVFVGNTFSLGFN